MHWIALIFAAAFEVLWFICVSYLKNISWEEIRDLSFLESESWELKLGAMAGYVVFGILNMLCFSKAVQKIPETIAFSVWTGLAVVGLQMNDAFNVDIFSTPIKLVFIGLIVIGVIGLKTTSGKEVKRS